MEGITKQAILVETTFLTRVVVDVNESGDILDWDSLVEQIKSSLRSKMSNDEVEENIGTILPDDECPYGTYPGEKC